jgi:septum formation protein
MSRLILGSASPRRAALLRELGAEFAVCASDVPEVAGAGEPAEAFARRMAREKGTAVAQVRAGAWVLSADTIVVVDGVVLGKPANTHDARHMLQRLSGRVHEVVTAVALIGPDGQLAAELLVRSAVEFRPLGAAQIDEYVAGGEPLDKAGAYGIQGAAAAFVAAVRGSYSNVVGLPLDEVRDLLERFALLPIPARPGARGAER